MEKIGLPALHARAEAWQCDFNGHWNTRYYCRAFDIAARVGAALSDPGGAGAPPIGRRHIRFHREVFAGDALEVRSFRLRDPTGASAVGHYMYRDGAVVAAALDHGDTPCGALPEVAAERAPLALPRGLAHPLPAPFAPDAGRDDVVELGPVRPGEVVGGVMDFTALVARLSIVSHHHVAALGYTPDYTKRTGVGRMLVEFRFQRLGAGAEGDFLRGTTRLTSVQQRSYTTTHLIHTHAGTQLALLELCTLAVDMNTHRTTTLPDFMLRQA